MLVRSGPWKSNLRASGSDSIVRFSGNLASDAERVVAERALLAVAGDRPVEFEIGVGTPAASVGAPSVSAVAWRHGTLGGPVRNALLQHYEDAARRSFQEPAQGLLESELDRFVSGVLRHDAELLSHVHALHGLLTRSRLAAGERPAESFRKVAEFHLDGIGQHRAGVAGQLSESLPRRFWSYRGKRRPEVTPEDARGMAELLLRDALALDQALAALFFGSGATVEFRASNLSTADLLARIRHSARQLRSALR